MKPLDKRSIDEHVELLEEFALLLMNEALERETRIAPDVLIGLAMDGACQVSESLGLIHGVTSRESDIGKGIGDDDLHQLGGGHLPTPLEIP